MLQAVNGMFWIFANVSNAVFLHLGLEKVYKIKVVNLRKIERNAMFCYYAWEI
jgi:hypothetical protein